MTKQSFHARIWAKLAGYNRAWNLLRPGDRILVGVSGGPDSVCLAHYLYNASRRMKLAVHLIHLHHGLRGPEADRDARFVGKLGSSLGLPVITRRIPVAMFARKTRRSLEEAGRILRYRTFAKEAKRLHFNKVATAHQMDDIAETFILNLMRGTQAKGLAGIPPRRPMISPLRPLPYGGDRAKGSTPPKTSFGDSCPRNMYPRATSRTVPAADSCGREGRARGIEVIRPLLCLSRKEVADYLRYYKLSFRIDSSNGSMKFTRNWVRRKVLPLLEMRSPQIRDHIAQIAQDLRLKLRQPDPGANR